MVFTYVECNIPRIAIATRYFLDFIEQTKILSINQVIVHSFLMTFLKKNVVNSRTLLLQFLEFQNPNSTGIPIPGIRHEKKFRIQF